MDSLIGFLADPFRFEFMQRALVALALVSIVSAVVGAFVVVKGMAFIGDALAHASFAGVAAAFVMGASIYYGAVAAAVLTALAITYVSRQARIQFDTAIGILFVGAFSLGIVIISAQDVYTVDLFSFVFGNVLGVGWEDVWLIGVMGAVVVLLVATFYKELLFTVYDPTMAAAVGIPVALVQYGLLALIGLSTVIALKAVGIVLVVAMLVTPPATATLFVRRLPAVMAMSAGLAMVSSVIGLYVSYHAGTASGASIVLVATVFFLAGLIASPRRGLVAGWLASRREDRPASGAAS
jgi:ABC-type Mn2+/Zn2+ transport system permease subunit